LFGECLDREWYKLLLGGNLTAGIMSALLEYAVDVGE
jgi:hypothetical protein